MLQCFTISSKHQLIAIKMILYLSYFYTSRELPIRLSVWWCMMSVADIVACFLAFGLLHMRGVSGVSGWRWLFLIEVFRVTSIPKCPQR